MKKHILCSIVILLQLPVTLIAQYSSSGLGSRVFFGGNLGLQFGTITQIDVSPIVGYKVSPRFLPGVGITYSYYSDKRYDYKNTLYGAKVFAQFFVFNNIFAYSEIAPVNTSQLVVSSSVGQVSIYESERYWITNVLIGGGYSQPVSERSSINMMVLWDLNHSYRSPYTNPVIRVGFQF